MRRKTHNAGAPKAVHLFLKQQEGQDSMWVYPKTEMQTVIKPVSAQTGTEAKTALPVVSEPVIASAAPPQAPAVNSVATPVAPKRKHLSRPSRDCILLVAAYLLGTFAAGILQARCDAGEAEMLTYYLQCWQNLFAVQNASQVAGLFAAELATVWGGLTVLLLLGLSAFGALPIYLFAMLYGAGMGLLSVQLLSDLGWKPLLLVGLFSGVPTALAAGVLCLFGASALRVSSRLHAFSFGHTEKSRGASPGARLLVGQFALACGAFLPLCGGATCLAYLANHLG